MIESSFSLSHLTKKLSRPRLQLSIIHFHFLEKRVSVPFQTLTRNPRNYPAQQRVSSVGVGPDKVRRVAGVFTSQVFKHPRIIVSPGLEGESPVKKVAGQAGMTSKDRPDPNWIVRVRFKPQGRQD